MTAADAKPDFATHFVEGVRCFNTREFWHAHEAWEQIWLAAESDVEQYLQGLIQLTAAYHHIQRGTFSGAGRLINAALRRLAPLPESFCGLDHAPAVAMAIRHRAWVEERIVAGDKLTRLPDHDYPRLTLLVPDGAAVPPLEIW